MEIIEKMLSMPGNQNEEEPEIIRSEVLDAVKQFKNNDTPDYDQTMAEHFKYGGNRITNHLTPLCNHIKQPY